MAARTYYPITLVDGWYNGETTVTAIIHRGRVYIWSDIVAWGGATTFDYDDIGTMLCDVGGIPPEACPSSTITVPIRLNAGCGSDFTWNTEINPDGSWVILDRATRPEKFRSAYDSYSFVLHFYYDLVDGAVDEPATWNDAIPYLGTDTGGFGGVWTSDDVAIAVHSGIAHGRGSITADSGASIYFDVPLEFAPSAWNSINPQTGSTIYRTFVTTDIEGLQKDLSFGSFGGQLAIVIVEPSQKVFFSAYNPLTEVFIGADMLASDTLEGPGSMTFYPGGDTIPAYTAVGGSLERNVFHVNAINLLTVGAISGIAFGIQSNGDHYRLYHEVIAGPTAQVVWSKVEGGVETVLNTVTGNPLGFTYAIIGSTMVVHVGGLLIDWVDSSPLSDTGSWGYFHNSDGAVNSIQIYLPRPNDGYMTIGDTVSIDGMWWPIVWKAIRVNYDMSLPITQGAPDFSSVWDYGDGGDPVDVGFNWTPFHDYNEPGTYSVTLTVTDSIAREDSVTKDVVIPEV